MEMISSLKFIKISFTIGLYFLPLFLEAHYSHVVRVTKPFFRQPMCHPSKLLWTNAVERQKLGSLLLLLAYYRHKWLEKEGRMMVAAKIIYNLGHLNTRSYAYFQFSYTYINSTTRYENSLNFWGCFVIFLEVLFILCIEFLAKMFLL